MEYYNRLRVSRQKIASGQFTGGYMKDARFSYYPVSRPGFAGKRVRLSIVEDP